MWDFVNLKKWTWPTCPPLATVLATVLGKPPWPRSWPCYSHPRAIVFLSIIGITWYWTKVSDGLQLRVVAPGRWPLDINISLPVCWRPRDQNCIHLRPMGLLLSLPLTVLITLCSLKTGRHRNLTRPTPASIYAATSVTGEE